MHVGNLTVSQDQALFVVLIVALVALVVVVLMNRPAPGAPAPSWGLGRVFLLIALILFILTGLGVVPGLPWGLAFWVASALV
jgi:hypothetical protein